MTDPIPLPSLEEIEQIEKKRQQAIDALEISNGFVKCQRCHVPQRIVGKLRPTGNNGRISSLRVRLNHLKTHDAKEQDIEQVQQELDRLLQYDAQYDKLRSIPLYCTKKTRYQFVCGECFTKANRRT